LPVGRARGGALLCLLLALPTSRLEQSARRHRPPLALPTSLALCLYFALALATSLLPCLQAPTSSPTAALSTTSSAYLRTHEIQAPKVAVRAYLRTRFTPPRRGKRAFANTSERKKYGKKREKKGKKGPPRRMLAAVERGEDGLPRHASTLRPLPPASQHTLKQ